MRVCYPSNAFLVTTETNVDIENGLLGRREYHFLSLLQSESIFKSVKINRYLEYSQNKRMFFRVWTFSWKLQKRPH